MIHKLIIFIFFFAVGLKAQDKLFLKDGKIKKVFIVSVANDVVFYKNSDTSIQTYNISKKDLLLIENYKGDVSVFSENKKSKGSELSPLPVYKRNAIGLQPFGILTGRATLVYERFTKDNKIGFVIPFSLTFDPIGTIYKSRIDTSVNALTRLKGTNYIIGLDVNFYIGEKENSKFFVGPRIRYGTDMFLRGLEAYSVQTQIGWKYGDPQKPFIQHFSIGFGLVRVLSVPTTSLIGPKQFYGWYSINYRVGIKW